MCELAGKRVLVVGGGRAGSLAAQVAQGLAHGKAALAVTARSKGKLQTPRMLEGQGAACVVGFAADGADAGAVARCVQDAEEALGGLDALVVAGMASVAGVPLARLKAAQLETAWRTGPAALFNWLSAAHDALVRARGHAVVCLPPEECARVAGPAVSSACAAMRALCESADGEWGKEGVSCDVVDAFVETSSLAQLAAGEKEAFAEFSARVARPLQAPAELAARIADLLR